MELGKLCAVHSIICQPLCGTDSEWKNLIREAKHSTLPHWKISHIFLRLQRWIHSRYTAIQGSRGGSGWRQAAIGCVDIACYHRFGLPLGAFLGYEFELGAKGVWSGILISCVL